MTILSPARFVRTVMVCSAFLIPAPGFAGKNPLQVSKTPSSNFFKKAWDFVFVDLTQEEKDASNAKYRVSEPFSALAKKHNQQEIKALDQEIAVALKKQDEIKSLDNLFQTESAVQSLPLILEQLRETRRKLGVLGRQIIKVRDDIAITTSQRDQLSTDLYQSEQKNHYFARGFTAVAAYAGINLSILMVKTYFNWLKKNRYSEHCLREQTLLKERQGLVKQVEELEKSITSLQKAQANATLTEQEKAKASELTVQLSAQRDALKEKVAALDLKLVHLSSAIRPVKAASEQSALVRWTKRIAQASAAYYIAKQLSPYVFSPVANTQYQQLVPLNQRLEEQKVDLASLSIQRTDLETGHKATLQQKKAILNSLGVETEFDIETNLAQNNSHLNKVLMSRDSLVHAESEARLEAVKKQQSNVLDTLQFLVPQSVIVPKVQELANFVISSIF